MRLSQLRSQHVIIRRELKTCFLSDPGLAILLLFRYVCGSALGGSQRDDRACEGFQETSTAPALSH